MSHNRTWRLPWQASYLVQDSEELLKVTHILLPAVPWLPIIIYFEAIILA